MANDVFGWVARTRRSREIAKPGNTAAGSRCWLFPTATGIACALLCGCTLIGAGSGALIDSAIAGPYEHRPIEQIERLEPGDDIVLRTSTGNACAGDFIGLARPTSNRVERSLVISTRSGLQLVPLSGIDGLDVEVAGKGWLYGGAIGLVLDVAVVVIASATMSEMKWTYRDTGPEWGK